MPRYIVERQFEVKHGGMPQMGSKSRRILVEQMPEVVWEYSHVSLGDDGELLRHLAPPLAVVRGNELEGLAVEPEGLLLGPASVRLLGTREEIGDRALGFAGLAPVLRQSRRDVPGLGDSVFQETCDGGMALAA